MRLLAHWAQAVQAADWRAAVGAWVFAIALAGVALLLAWRLRLGRGSIAAGRLQYPARVMCSLILVLAIGGALAQGRIDSDVLTAAAFAFTLLGFLGVTAHQVRHGTLEAAKGETLARISPEASENRIAA